jgi:hypothetical protein
MNKQLESLEAVRLAEIRGGLFDGVYTKLLGSAPFVPEPTATKATAILDQVASVLADSKRWSS